jgi:hypothetical protein
LYLQGTPVAQRVGSPMPDIAYLLATGERLRRFHRLLTENGLGDGYEASHTRLALECLATTHTRLTFLNQGSLKPLAAPVSQAAADQLYLDTVRKLVDGLGRVLTADEKSADLTKRTVAQLWGRSAAEPR